MNKPLLAIEKSFGVNFLMCSMMWFWSLDDENSDMKITFVFVKNRFFQTSKHVIIEKK